MTDEDISKAIDAIAVELHGRGLDADGVESHLVKEVARVCFKLAEDEENDETR